MPRVEINGHVVEFATMPTPEDIDHVASTLPSTTTTPTTRTFPQALGETARATITRPLEAGAEFAHQRLASPEVLAAERKAGVLSGRGPIGQLSTLLAPFLAPEMTAGGAAFETMRRMQPGTTEKEAEQAASTGQLATGLVTLGAPGLSPIPGMVRDVRAARSAAKLAKAGVSLGEGVSAGAARQVLTEELEKSVGPLDQTTFAKQIRPVFRAMFRDARRTMREGTLQQTEAVAPRLKDLQKLVHETEDWAPIADAVAKKPVLLANLIRRGDQTLLPKLQQAWLTAKIAAATGREGLNKGVVDVERVINDFNDLGEAGQTALFSNRAPELRATFESLRAAVPSGATGKTVAVGGGIFGMLNNVLRAGGVGAGLYEMGEGKVLRGAGIAAVPFLLGKVLLKNGGAEWVRAVATAARDSTAFAQAAPTLGRFGLKVLQSADPGTERQPPAAPMLFGPGLAMPPRPAPSANAGLGSPGGIMAAIENTVLPPGWRPGMAPVMR